MPEELGHGFAVHEPGPEIEKIRIWKVTDHLSIELRPSNMYINIYPVEKDGRLVDLRIVARLDDDYYVDEPPSSDVMVIKHESEPTDKELLAKQYKPKHRYTSMTREFTQEEKKEILKFLHENKRMDILEVADIFIEKWGIPISETGIRAIITAEVISQLRVD